MLANTTILIKSRQMSVNHQVSCSILLFLCICVSSLVFSCCFYIGGSDSFMGDARRLSEAGVRRSSGLFCDLFLNTLSCMRSFK